MKVNATTIHGKLNQKNNSWIGTEIASSFYQSSLLMDLTFQNLEEMGYVINHSESNRQIYPSIYTHEYLTEPEIKKIQKLIYLKLLSWEMIILHVEIMQNKL